MPENNGYTVNQDGSIDIAMDGKPIRFVKESDLLAVKSGKEEATKSWEGERTKFQADLAEANRIREDAHNQLLQTQANSQKLLEQYKDYDTIKTRAGDLEKEVGSHKEKLSKNEKDLVTRITQNLISAGAKEDQLKGKTLDQLKQLEMSADIFGRKATPARYDSSRGGGGVAESQLERATRILADAEEKGHT